MRTLFVALAITVVTAATGAAQPVDTPVEMDCMTSARGISGESGTSVLVSCPAQCTTAVIVGTDIYSSDSSVCTAAVHAGVIPTAGGLVLVTLAEGQESYDSSTRNGITSLQWGPWRSSFMVSPPAVTLTCADGGDGLGDDIGAVYLVTCPADCSGEAVWGNRIYRDASSVCAASIHAGVISSDGGSVLVTISEGRDSYPASTANGVTTAFWGGSSRGFSVAVP